MSIVLLLVVIFSMLLATILAVSNSYFVNLKGASVDAERFLLKADEWISNGSVEFVIDAEFFIQFLGMIQSCLPLDEFWLTAIGIVLYYSTFIFIFSRFKGAVVSGFSFLLTILCFLCFLTPSVLLRVSALLREPYSIFFGVLAVWFAVQFITSKRYELLGAAVVCIIFAGFFHKAYLAFVPIFFVLIILFSLKINARSLGVAGLLGIGFVLTALYIAPHLGSLRGGDALSAVISGDFSVAEKIVSYKSGVDARATYNYGANFSSSVALIFTALRANLYFYLSPFPWKISNVLDIFVFIENITRVLSLFLVLRIAFRDYHKEVYFIIFCYLALNSIWALGTSNYGTGSRHHMTTMPLLMMAYFMALSFLAKKNVSEDDKKVNKL